VRRSLAATPPPAPSASRPGPVATPGNRATLTPSPGGSQSPPKGAVSNGVFPASAGTVFASCSSGLVTLTRWIPEGGYGAGESAPGPARSAWVQFESASTELTVTATCAGGQPHFVTSTDDRHGAGGGGGGDDHGGGGGQGGDGGGGDDSGGGHGGR
jgi:hypothetical protein